MRPRAFQRLPQTSQASFLELQVLQVAQEWAALMDRLEDDREQEEQENGSVASSMDSDDSDSDDV